MINAAAAAGTSRLRCDMCATERSKLHCAACARAALYPSRLAQAHCLVERAACHRRACAIIDTDGGLQPSVAKVAPDEEALVHEHKKTTQRNHLRDQSTILRERLDLIVSEASNLRRRLGHFKQLAQQKRASLDQRRADIKSTQLTLGAWQDGTIEALKKAVRRAASKHASIQTDIVSARADLCKEAANLAGLQQRQYKPTDSSPEELFMLGGSFLFDLRELHNIPPHQFTNAMTNITRLLALSCHYLHIRLPAQILLPGRDHALPAICSPLTSYDGRTVSTTASVTSATRGPSDSNTAPRARPLWAHRPISVLAKEDHNAYSRIIEAASLLAWDIAWLCRVQGILIAADEWSDIAAIGRNLWLLLNLGPDQRGKPGSRNAPSATTPRTAQALVAGEGQSLPPSFKASSFGVFSHGTAFNFLDSAAFTRPLETDVSAPGWRFSHPSRVSDHLKAYLQAEMSGLEWELLDDGEMYRSDSITPDAAFEVVNSRGHTKRTRTSLLERGNEDAASVDDRVRAPSHETLLSDREQPRNGGSGWTKLKSRSPQ